ARAHIVVDFAGFGEVGSLPRPVQDDDGTWRLEETPVVGGPSSGQGPSPLWQATVRPSNLLLLLFCFGVALTVHLYRRHGRKVYAVIVIVVVLSLVATPLLQAGRLVHFFESYAHADEPAAAGQQSTETEDRPPPALTLTPPAEASPTKVSPTPASPSRVPEGRRASTMSSGAQTACGRGDANTDTDGDGLNDRDENCLGTDPGHEDSDRDTITDTLELGGFEFPPASGQIWYGDPLKADSNEDGLLDGYEWPEPYGNAPEWDTDGDGIPAPWDEDNDGDGVPDSLDLAPYAYSDYGDSFTLSTQGGGFDGYEFIEIQVQPQDLAHLRYSLSALNWPFDYEGQIRDLDHSKEDIQLIPMLEITTNTAPDKELAVDYGVAVVENDDGSYTLYAALSPLDNGGQITAFSAKVAYEPEKLDDIRWEETHLVWVTYMQNDSYKFHNPGWTTVAESVPLVTYTDPFRVTGLQVSKGREFESAVLGTPAWPDDDRTLFQAALAAGSTFMSYQTPTLADVADRFHNPDPNADPLYTWGLHPADVEEDMPLVYANRDEGLADTNQRLFDFLDAQGYGHGSSPSLLTLMEEDIGAWTMGEGASGQVAAQFNVDLDNVSLTTQRTAKLTTYEYQDGAWRAMPVEDTLHLMQERYDSDSLEPVRAGLEDDYPDLTTVDLQTTVLMFYVAWLNGRNKVSKVDADDLLDPAPADLDQQTYDAVHLPDNKYDNLSAYLLEAAELGEPGGGFRLGGAPARAWDYQRAHSFTVDAFSILPLDFNIFYKHLQNLPGAPLPPWEMLTALNFAKFAFAAYTWRQLVQLMKAGELATPLSLDKLSNHKLGGIATGVTLLVIWITFAAGTDFSNPFVWKTALANAVAASIFALLTFAMSFMPGFAAWLAIFILVDLIILFVTWGKTSITGKVIEWIGKAFYEVRELTSFDDMDFKDAQGGLKNEQMGLIAGNSYVLSQVFEGTLKYTGDADDDDIDDSTAYAWFEASSADASAAGGRSSTDCDDADGEIVCTNELSAEFYFDQPHRNIHLQVDTYVHARTYYEECKLWGASCDRSNVIIDLPDDLNGDDRRHWEPVTLDIDVLPDTVGALWTWDEISAPDRDGDRLSNEYEADLGTDPDLWDTDGDGLDDKFEVDNREDVGCDPLAADTDGDGLSDAREYHLKTGVDQPDSDDDGLLDGEEVFHQDIFDTDGDGNTDEWLGGWLVDDLPETAQAYWVSSDPTQADADDDGLDDKAEKAYHTSPQAYNDAPRLELAGDPLAVSPDGDEAVYLEPGDSVTLDLSLDSVGPNPISATVTLCLPDFLTNLQGGQMSGDRTPPRQDAGCNGFQWDFSGANTLQTWERVSTTVTAVAANAPSARGEAVVSFPYPMGDETQDIESRVGVTLDNEDPAVSVSAPGDGELIGGGVSDYVVGGNAGDETSWVDHVSLQLPGAGTVTAEGENPWAYTWNLPADGVYDLIATAYDYLGHASGADTVQVTVDNTVPGTTLDLADGAYVTAQVSGVITIPLSGTASDNLSGLTRVQISLDGKPWREVWTSQTYPLDATWSAEWRLPNADSASGEHLVMVRALDRAGNYSDVLERTIVVDVLPPSDELGNRIYRGLGTGHADPPHLPPGQPVDLYGVANDAGNAPAPSRPEELLGTLDGLFDATIWLGLPSVFDNDSGVNLAWLGDFNNDRLADLALGLPAAEADHGRVVVVYGRAGDWPAPDDVEPVAESRTSFVGKRGSSGGGGLGASLSPAGDANGDGLADLLIGDPSNRRFFLVFGSTSPLGQDLRLDGPADGRSVLRNESQPYNFGRLQAPAGDVNGDGLDDLLLGVSNSTTTMVYLLLGTPSWFDEIYVDKMAAVQIDTGSRYSTFAGVGDLDGDQYDDFAVTSGTTVYL
ncbi:MAG: Ig-like domain-containing protein, partial [Anaerolineae bacterium]